MNPNALIKIYATAGQIDSLTLVLILFFMLAVLFGLLYMASPKLWIAAKLTKTPVTMMEIIGMRFRRVPPEKIVNPMMTASMMGIDIPQMKLQGHFLAGGDPEKVVQALLIAKKADLDLDIDQACVVDLTPDQGIVQIVRETAEKKQG